MKDSMIFECQTITPVFMSGSNKKLELRAPSLKGIMRFWWRAIQAEERIDQVKKKEAEIFGGIGRGEGKSKISIRINGVKRLNTGGYPILPHHTGDSNCPICPKNGNNSRCKGRTLPAIIDQTFNVVINYNMLPRDFISEQLKALFILTSITGGLGKRSRRGFGVFKILSIDGQEFSENINIDYILQLLEILVPNKYTLDGDKIVLVNEPTGSYPFIQEIAIGKPYTATDKLLRDIGQASHDHSSMYTGFAGKNKQRLASPVYVSLISGKVNYYPVITTLKTVFGR